MSALDLSAPDLPAAPQAIRLTDYRPAAFRVPQIDLDIDLHPEKTQVIARLTVERTRIGEPLVLDGEKMKLVGLALDGRALDSAAYQLDAESLTIRDAPDRFVLTIHTEIDPVANKALEGLYQSNGNYCTQCEPEGFRKITYYLDRPDNLARFTTRITAPKASAPVLLANGNLAGQGDLDDGRHWALWEDPFLKPSYLFALVAGDLGFIEDHFTTMSGRRVQLRIYTEHPHVDKCAFAMDSLKRAMAWDEQVYGREYDLDIFNIVAVSDFNMGAMENKGLNIFNTKYILARPETATDMDYAGIESVVAHEYFHNWSGNRVTCRDWFQLSLKEGFTVFRDQQFSEDQRSAAIQRIEAVRTLRAIQFPEDGGPTAHPVRPASYVEINNFYTPTVYNKGAEVIRMMRTLLGPDKFRAGSDLYFSRFDGQAATCDDFVAAMEEASGVDLSHFKLWYSQAGTPVLDIAGSHDPATGLYRLDVAQTVPPTPDMAEKKPMQMPLVISLLDEAGRALPLADGQAEQVLDIRAARQSFEFKVGAAKPVPSLLHRFSAPVKLRYAYSAADLQHVLAHSPDPFARWEAAQQWAVNLLLGLVADAQTGRPLALDPAFTEVYARLLQDQSLDLDFIAELFRLPTESYLGQQMDPIDVDAIHAAWRAAANGLAAGLAPLFWQTYDRIGEVSSEDVSPAAASRRGLKNLALSYLMRADDPRAAEICAAQAVSAGNMTDSIAALGSLARTDRPERPDALDAFYRKWKHEPLVVDKWFSLQATADRADVFADVQSLMGHPAFTLDNPNRVRSLVGAFTANQIGFHDKSGQGYRFLADQVLRLDGQNPQLAARMAGSLARWRKYDAGRQAQMRTELERLLAAKNLSKDCYEIVSKSLA